MTLLFSSRQCEKTKARDSILQVNEIALAGTNRLVKNRCRKSGLIAVTKLATHIMQLSCSNKNNVMIHRKVHDLSHRQASIQTQPEKDTTKTLSRLIIFFLQNINVKNCCFIAWINPKKSVCMRIGPRYNMSCYDIVSSNRCALQWVESVRYLGVYFVKARQFKCRYDRATASFYRAFNAVFGKIDRS